MSQQKNKKKIEWWSLCHHFTFGVVTYTELFFYKLGIFVGKHPIRTIVICWGAVIFSAFGFFNFQQEKNPLKLWVPPHTTFVKDSEWLMKSLHRGYREQVIMITADDVLTPSIIQQLYNIDDLVRQTKSENGIRLKDVCFIIPKPDFKMLDILEDNTTKLDASAHMNAALYCSFVEAMKKECYTKSILDLWDYKRRSISALTKDDIINAVNNDNSKLLFGNLKNVETLLGGIERNESGHIIKATAIQNYWYLTVNLSAIDMDKAGNLAGTADFASEEVLEWENTFLTVMQNLSTYVNHSYYYYAGRSFGDISNDSMFQDMDLLCFGIIMMIIYVQLVISKFNWLEARLVLGSFGMLTIGMAFIVGAGLCSLLGNKYGPLHTALPFLLMGLGVDDMFVILACWEELGAEEKKLPIHEKIGLMLKHAGVSITITSFTDVIAFLIGASTILPCLEAFCFFAAMGVFMTFVFAITFFVACFVLDERRRENRRNGVIPWIVHEENYAPNKCSQRNLSNSLFNLVYSKVILTTPGKVIVIMISIICMGFATQSALELEQRFDPRWFLPEGAHLGEFLDTQTLYYPDNGFYAGLYMGTVNYSQEITKIRDAALKLEEMNVTNNVMSWVEPFRDYVMINFHEDMYSKPLSDDMFHLYLSKFLNSPKNAKYQANFIFDRDLECGLPAPKIKLSLIDFYFYRYNNPRDQIPAMHKVMSVAENMNFTTGDKVATVWSKYFATWITDELIDVEVMRNLQLALLCVMLCTILLIADWQTCFWIFICVLITMVDVMGFMQRWGLTIDLVSCIGLELAIGLCVDYATHVGHTFLTVSEGKRQDRSIKTVTSIGSAVFYGGFSTFIGVFMMSQSKAYTFQSFFKIFFLVIVFGLFHGVVLLPVILSLIGPKPYRVHKPVPQIDVEML